MLELVEVAGFDPAASRTRTGRSPRLSYTSITLVRVAGFDPATSCTPSTRSPRLSYTLITPPTLGRGGPNRPAFVVPHPVAVGVLSGASSSVSTEGVGPSIFWSQARRDTASPRAVSFYFPVPRGGIEPLLTGLKGQSPHLMRSGANSLVPRRGIEPLSSG